MSAGINHLPEINQFKVASFECGGEGFNTLANYLENATDSKLASERQKLLENSLSDLGEVKAVSKRLTAFVEELGKKPKNELTPREKTLKKTAASFADFLGEANFKKAWKERADALVGALTFGDFTQTYVTKGSKLKHGKDVNIIPDSFKFEVVMIKSLIESIVDKDSSTIAAKGWFKGFEKGENFDVFTKILSQNPQLLTLGTAKFREDTEDKVNALKVLLNVYSVAFEKLGAAIVPDEQERAAIKSGIEIMKNVLDFDLKTVTKTVYDAAPSGSVADTKEKLDFETIIVHGPDSVGTNNGIKWIKGKNYEKLAMLLLTPRGLKVINDRIEESDEEEKETLKLMFWRFWDIFETTPSSLKEKHHMIGKVLPVCERLDLTLLLAGQTLSSESDSDSDVDILVV